MEISGIFRNINGAIIAFKKKWRQEMVDMICPKCQGISRTDKIQLSCSGRVTVTGIIRCGVCKHEFPFTMYGGQSDSFIQKLDTALPGAQSDRLNPSVPVGIREDIQEAERANYAQCYKASVAMCRRALQLSLIDKGIGDAPLSKMLEQAKVNKTLTDNTYNLATSIKGYGDIGVHRTDQLDPKEVELVIYTTVRMLNEIFP